MTIKVKERSDTDIMIRCNLRAEKEYVKHLFLSLQSLHPELGIVVKDINGKEIRKKKEEITQKAEETLSPVETQKEEKVV